MAIWTSTPGRSWEYNDGKKNFDEWVNETPERSNAWRDACAEVHAWLSVNPASTANDCDLPDAKNIFQQWLDYSGAKFVE